MSEGRKGSYVPLPKSHSDNPFESEPSRNDPDIHIHTSPTYTHHPTTTSTLDSSVRTTSLRTGSLTVPTRFPTFFPGDHGSDPETLTHST